MVQEYYESPYRKQWKLLYPLIDFPDPKQYPHMFHEGTADVEPFTYLIYEGNQQCTDIKYCPKGIVDYQCQLKYDCYINLANLALHVIGYTLALVVITGGITKLITIIFKALNGIALFAKVFFCLGDFLKKVSFGVMGQEIVYVDKYRKQSKKKTKNQQKLIRKLQNIDIEINVEALDNFQIQKLNEVMSDYSLQTEGLQEKKNAQK